MSGIRGARVAARGHDDRDGRVLAPHGGGDLGESAGRGRVQDGGQRGVEALEDRLGLRVAETHVEFDDADALRGHREAAVQEAAEGGAATHHLGDDGLGHLVDNALRGLFGEPRQGAVGAHAARVRALVAVAHALEVLRGLQRHDSSTVSEAEERDLGAVEVVLDDDRSRVARQAGARMLRGLGAVGGHDDALAGGKRVILHDVGGTQIVERGLNLVQRGAREGASRRHAGIGHDLFRERLGGLETRRVLRRAKNGDSVVQDRIRDARDERRLGADDHEVDVLRRGATDDVLRIQGIHCQGATQLLQRGVTRLDDELNRMLGGGRSYKRTGDRVFATPVTNEKNLHDSSLSVFGGLPGHRGVLWVHVTAKVRRACGPHQAPFGLPLRRSSFLSRWSLLR